MATLMQQIHIGLGREGYVPVAHHHADKATYTQEHEAMQASLVNSCPAHLWPKNSHKAACPRPILMTKQHQTQLAELHEALTAAITDIVERWWTDKESRFPERMPLTSKEEDLLQWLEEQVSRGTLPKYAQCRGGWRPDFMIEDPCDDGLGIENFRITEINARFSFNGFMHQAYGQRALDDMGVKAHGFVAATSAAGALDGLLGLFRVDVPLHLLKAEEKGMDIHMMMHDLQRRFGFRPRLITPADLRLLPDPENSSRQKLYCVVRANGHHGSCALKTHHGEVVEEIVQLGLELHQRELLALEPEMLRQVCLLGFNDMRTLLLVHDKRMLGIVRQELGSLVARGVLTQAQAEVLDRGIAKTILAGSAELRQLLAKSRSCPKLRHQYILKPIRGGKGAGILFGDSISIDVWIRTLERMQTAGLGSEASYVVQRRISPRLYDMVLDSSGDRVQYPLVGTYHAVHGTLVGLGIWRTSGDRICAISTGGSWLCSVLRGD
ncbi:hypothetical protein H634G_09840 [Metarhizium anisopliae BRIP 53293]|uniref:Taurine catabolism dioxygenase TauD n=1 Tax=Metarhizium anisopliae BRIP 53293 TaxID=1291518 RepID=A0A0D9NLN0_METAN|nr:hypothetical protein H634G_09840 [Metarhizium anisopliae BRIP 53293]KJK85064.1 hypothetical protein H633G_11107 [Metarhizium anisopliae BRIP 53284]